MTRPDEIALANLANRLERKLDKWVRKGYRSDCEKVARTRLEVAAIRRTLGK